MSCRNVSGSRPRTPTSKATASWVGPTSWGTGPRSPPTPTWGRLESRRRSTPDPTWVTGRVTDASSAVRPAIAPSAGGSTISTRWVRRGGHPHHRGPRRRPLPGQRGEDVHHLRGAPATPPRRCAPAAPGHTASHSWSSTPTPTGPTSTPSTPPRSAGAAPSTSSAIAAGASCRCANASSCCWTRTRRSSSSRRWPPG